MVNRDTVDQHYEEQFEFPLWKKIKEYAEKHDCSYLAAQNVVLRDFCLNGGLRYRDEAYEDPIIKARWDELKKVAGTGDALLYDSKKRGK